MGRVYRHDLFLIREVPDALMLSCLVDCLRLVVRVRPLVSVAVSGDRHSVSYSPLGSAQSGPAPDLLIRRSMEPVLLVCCSPELQVRIRQMSGKEVIVRCRPVSP